MTKDSIYGQHREKQRRREKTKLARERFVALKLLLMVSFSISVTLPSFINKFSVFEIVQSLGLMHCNIPFSCVINTPFTPSVNTASFH